MSVLPSAKSCCDGVCFLGAMNSERIIAASNLVETTLMSFFVRITESSKFMTLSEQCFLNNYLVLFFS